MCKERLKSCELKYLDLICNEIHDLTLNQTSAIEGVKFQTNFEDRFPYSALQLNSLTKKQQERLRNIFYYRQPYS